MDKRRRSHLNRAFATWIRALEMAVIYGHQTGRKWHVYRAGDSWRIRRTHKPIQRDYSTKANREALRRWATYGTPR